MENWEWLIEEFLIIGINQFAFESEFDLGWIWLVRLEWSIRVDKGKISRRMTRRVNLDEIIVLKCRLYWYIANVSNLLWFFLKAEMKWQF